MGFDRTLVEFFIELLKRIEARQIKAELGRRLMVTPAMDWFAPDILPAPLERVQEGPR